jgi:hypothetical protein
MLEDYLPPKNSQHKILSRLSRTFFWWGRAEIAVAKAVSASPRASRVWRRGAERELMAWWVSQSVIQIWITPA